MKRILMLVVVSIAAGSMAVADLADAKRLGGGRSFGTQRSMPAPSAPSAGAPATTPGAAPNPVMPAQPGTNYARPAAPAAAAGTAAAPARAGMSRWLAPLAGVAAGLGLAALLSHFGLSETFASFLLFALLVVAGIFVLRLFLGRRQGASPPLRYAGGAGDLANASRDIAASMPPSAGGPRVEPALRSPATPSAIAGPKVPADFDPAPLLAQARAQFVRLQSAYDRGDRAALADVMTPEMFKEVRQELDARGTHAPTEVVTLDAELVDVATEGDRHWASVRFTGTLREDGSAQEQALDEVWNLVKPIDGSSGWLLAGIQQMAAAS